MNSGRFYKEKILHLVETVFGGNNAKFLREAGLSHGYINKMKSKNNYIPGVDAINKMIDAAQKVKPDFNPLWLIRDGEEMYESRRRESDQAAEPGVAYVAKLVEELEQGGELRNEELPRGFEISVARLLVELLEQKQSG